MNSPRHLSTPINPQHPRPSYSPEVFVALCDETLKIFWTSPELKALTGLDPDEALGRSLSQLLNGPETDPDIVGQLHQHAALRQHFSRAMLGYGKNREPFGLHLSLAPVLTPQKELLHFMAIFTALRHADDGLPHLPADIERLENQRNVLIREVHHRIKNNLQGVAGMLRQHALTQPDAAPILERAIAQVRTIAVIHGLEGKALYNEVVLCEMAPSIARMVQELVLPDSQIINVQVNVPERIRVSEPERVPVALILNELIMNAAKHLNAKNAGHSLGVCVAWHDAQGCASITITNTGQLPPNFDFDNEQGIGTGLELVRAMLPSYGAELKFLNRPGFVETQLILRPPVIYSINFKQ